MPGASIPDLIEQIREDIAKLASRVDQLERLFNERQVIEIVDSPRDPVPAAASSQPPLAVADPYIPEPRGKYCIVTQPRPDGNGLPHAVAGVAGIYNRLGD